MRPLLILLSLLLLAALAPAADPLPQTLKDAYPHFLIGTALDGNLARRYSPAELQLVDQHFNCVTPGNCMKPNAIQRTEGQFTFDEADALVAFAQKHHLAVIGHVAVWHEQCPSWFFKDGDQPASRDLVLARMQKHIQTLIGRYKGKVRGWDVVNEAFTWGKSPYRNTLWFKRIGPDFIEQAFRFAHAADPGAELYYNDFGIESPPKRDHALALVRDLKAKGVRIDAVGIQGHWSLDRIPYKDIEDAIQLFHDAGVQVNFTEVDLDVLPRKTTGADLSQRESPTSAPTTQWVTCPPEVLQRQAEQYARLFTLFQKHHDKIGRITFWGLTDADSWLNNFPIRGRINHPLLFDRQAHPKPAFDALLRAAGTQ